MYQKIKSQYKTIWQYLKQHRRWCALTALLIIEMFVFAYLNTPPNTQYQVYVSETKRTYPDLFAFIFFENSKTMLHTILAGTIPLGFGVLFYTLSVFKGLVATFKFVLPNVGGWNLLLCSLPHGGLEIAAICFSILLSVLWCRAVTIAILRLFRRKPALAPLCRDCAVLVKCVLFIEIPLVFLAAATEATLSAWVVSRIL